MDTGKRPRDYEREANEIIDGASKLMPERAHLLALAHSIVTVRSNLQFVTALINALMLDPKQVTLDEDLLVFPPELVARGKDGLTRLLITARPDGYPPGTVVVVRQAPIPAAPEPPRVM